MAYLTVVTHMALMGGSTQRTGSREGEREKEMGWIMFCEKGKREKLQQKEVDKRYER